MADPDEQAVPAGTKEPEADRQSADRQSGPQVSGSTQFALNLTRQHGPFTAPLEPGQTV